MSRGAAKRRGFQSTDGRATLRVAVVRIAIALLVLCLMYPSLIFAQVPTPKRGGALRIAHVGEPPTLDQHWTTATITGEIMSHVNEGLFALNSRYEPKPMLAETWSISPDRRTYTFTLRREVRFHNGKELTSEDAKSSIERWIRLTARFRAMFAGVQISTPDPRTLVMKLPEPNGLVLLALAYRGQAAVIFPKEVIDEAGRGQVKRFIGTGPYRFVEHLPDRHIRLDRFDGYSARSEEPSGETGRKNAYFDSIYFLPVTDAAVRVAGVRSGDFHFALSVSNDEYQRLRADPKLDPIIAGESRWLAAVLNYRAGLMANRKIRQAFQAALDQAAIMRAAYGPPRFWRLDPALMPKGHYMWSDAGKEYVNQKNPTRARQLLTEAGYDGTPVRWMTTMEYPDYGTSAQAAKPMLERAGFVVDLQFTDWATLVSRRTRPELWDVYNAAFFHVPDPAFVLILQPNYPAGYNNREMGAMMTLLFRHSVPKVRSEIWKRMQRLWYEDVGSIKLGEFYSLNLQTKQLKGFVGVPSNIWWNAWLETER